MSIKHNEKTLESWSQHQKQHDIYVSTSTYFIGTPIYLSGRNSSSCCLIKRAINRAYKCTPIQIPTQQQRKINSCHYWVHTLWCHLDTFFSLTHTQVARFDQHNWPHQLVTANPSAICNDSFSTLHGGSHLRQRVSTRRRVTLQTDTQCHLSAWVWWLFA